MTPPALRRIITQLMTMRMTNGWNQKQAAAAIGISENHYGCMERLEKVPGADTLDNWAAVFGLELTLDSRGATIAESGDDLWREIRAIRQGLGLTLEDVQRATGIFANNLSMYETGKRKPEVDTLVRVLASLGCRLAIVGAKR